MIGLPLTDRGRGLHAQLRIDNRGFAGANQEIASLLSASRHCGARQKSGRETAQLEQGVPHGKIAAERHKRSARWDKQQDVILSRSFRNRAWVC